MCCAFVFVVLWLWLWLYLCVHYICMYISARNSCLVFLSCSMSASKYTRIQACLHAPIPSQILTPKAGKNKNNTTATVTVPTAVMAGKKGLTCVRDLELAQSLFYSRMSTSFFAGMQLTLYKQRTNVSAEIPHRQQKFRTVEHATGLCVCVYACVRVYVRMCVCA